MHRFARGHPRLRRLPRRQSANHRPRRRASRHRSRLCRGARPGPCPAALSGRLALPLLGQSAAQLHPAQHRSAGIRSLRQSERLSRGARILRRLPHGDHRGGGALAHGDGRDALGRGGLQ
jgi:hypothetical protein